MNLIKKFKEKSENEATAKNLEKQLNKLTKTNKSIWICSITILFNRRIKK